MPLHILLCDKVLRYFILRIEVVQSLNLNLNWGLISKKDLNKCKAFFLSSLVVGLKPSQAR
jgi:hypothetical protein